MFFMLFLQKIYIIVLNETLSIEYKPKLWVSSALGSLTRGRIPAQAERTSPRLTSISGVR